ncbi:MAG: protein kinase domain-containing protein [Gemmatimonas sp.]
MTSDPSRDNRSQTDRWQRISACFERALETPAGERVGLVEATFADDPESRREVLEMLSASADLGMLAGDAAEIFSGAGTRTPDTELARGSTVGAYQIDERVGRGGMGDVYRAHRADGVFDQQVAIKLLRGGLWGGALQHRFALERQILARLQHPDIVSIIDGGTTEDARPYLVMPFVEGRPIIDYCDANALGLTERLRLFMRVANAVQYAHTRLIVHRDIKPSNILVTDGGEVRLLDFGIAKLLGDDDTDSTHARSVVRLFTPEYCAPEQVSGLPVTAATDVHALGVLLYQLVCGERPNRQPGRTMRELEDAILHTDPPPASSVRSPYTWREKILGDLDQVILRALRKEPDRRYATAAQFSDDVARFLAGLPVQAVRDSSGYRARRFVQRHRLGVLASSVLALTVAAVAVLMTVQAGRLRAERDKVVREQTATNTVVNLLQSLFARSNPNMYPGGDSLRVAQLLDVGESMVDSLSAQPIVQARMWRALGNMHAARGRGDRAKELLSRSYERYRTSSGADSIDVISTLHEYARLVAYYDGREAAMPLFEESVKRLRNIVPDTSSDLRIAERELSQNLLDSRARLEALAKLAGNAKQPVNAQDSMSRASDLNALAVQKYGEGDYQSSLALFTEVFDILTALLPADHPNRLLLMGNVAATRDRLGDYVGGEALSREMVKQRRAATPVNAVGLGAALEYLANSMAHRGYLADADTLVREALILRRSAMPASHMEIVRSLQSRAMFVALRGRTADALAMSDTALALSGAPGTSQADRAAVRVRRLQVMIEAGKLDAARRELAELTPVVEREFTSTHPMRMAMDMNRALFALAEHRYDTALDAFTRLETALAVQMKPQHAEVSGATCGRAIAMRGLGRAEEARRGFEGACSRYRLYGTASPFILGHLAQTARP